MRTLEDIEDLTHENEASIIRHKFAISKQYWRLAADDVFKHECIDEKQLLKARRPIPAAEQAELKALTEKHEDEFEALDAEVQVEPYFECKCDTPNSTSMSRRRPSPRLRLS